MMKQARIWMVSMVVLALVAASAAQADQPRTVVSKGAWVRVSWSTTVHSKPAGGYLYASQLPDATVYVYFVIQVNGQQSTGWGVVPAAALTRLTPKDYRLTLASGTVASLTLSGIAPGAISVLWHSPIKATAINVGASGITSGPVTQITTGQWSSGAATATGSVLGIPVGNPQSAQMGSADKATQEFQLGH